MQCIQITYIVKLKTISYPSGLYLPAPQGESLGGRNGLKFNINSFNQLK